MGKPLLLSLSTRLHTEVRLPCKGSVQEPPSHILYHQMLSPTSEGKKAANWTSSQTRNSSSVVYLASTSST